MSRFLPPNGRGRFATRCRLRSSLILDGVGTAAVFILALAAFYLFAVMLNLAFPPAAP